MHETYQSSSSANLTLKTWYAKVAFNKNCTTLWRNSPIAQSPWGVLVVDFMLARSKSICLKGLGAAGCLLKQLFGCSRIHQLIFPWIWWLQTVVISALVTFQLVAWNSNDCTLWHFVALCRHQIDDPTEWLCQDSDLPSPKKDIWVVSTAVMPWLYHYPTFWPSKDWPSIQNTTGPYESLPDSPSDPSGEPILGRSGRAGDGRGSEVLCTHKMHSDIV